MPSCGFYQGDVTGRSLFNDVYNEQIAKWERHCEKRIQTRNICMRSAFLQVTSTMHHPPFLLTTSRNELTRIPHQEVITKMEETSRMLKICCWHWDCHEPKQRGTPGRFRGSWFGDVDANVAQREEMARQHGEIVPHTKGPGYTVTLQL